VPGVVRGVLAWGKRGGGGGEEGGGGEKGKEWLVWEKRGVVGVRPYTPHQPASNLPYIYI